MQVLVSGRREREAGAPAKRCSDDERGVRVRPEAQQREAAAEAGVAPLLRVHVDGVAPVARGDDELPGLCFF